MAQGAPFFFIITSSKFNCNAYPEYQRPFHPSIERPHHCYVTLLQNSKRMKSNPAKKTPPIQPPYILHPSRSNPLSKDPVAHISNQQRAHAEHEFSLPCPKKYQRSSEKPSRAHTSSRPAMPCINLLLGACATPPPPADVLVHVLI